MKLLLENWREYLNEEDSPLGKYVFPGNAGRLGQSLNPYHHKKAREEAAEEEDTSLEKTLWRALYQHFHDNIPLRKEDTDAIVQIIEKGLYSETFHRRRYGELYRGMAVPKKWFEELFGKLPEKPKWYRAPLQFLFKRAEKTFSNKDKPMYRPRQVKEQLSLFSGPNVITASSWTDKLGNAKLFAEQYVEKKGDVAIILVSDSSDPKNYFIDAEPLYEFDFASSFSDEEEIIGIGDIGVKEVIWLYGAEGDDGPDGDWE